MRIERYFADDWSPQKVTVKRCGNVTEVTEMESVPVAFMRNIDADYMMDLRTGELVEKQHSVSRDENIVSLKRTLKNLRDLINTNCCDPDKVLWLTLTYAENMCDTERLYRDYEKFWKRLCYWFLKNSVPKPEYISVAEPQERGAWHLHVILIWMDCPAPFISNNDVVWRLWGHGFTKTKGVSNCDNLGAYFSAYLADLDVTGSDAVVDGSTVVLKPSDDGRTLKKIAKGARLCLYPTGMRLYRHSRGVVIPVVEEVPPDSAQNEKVSAGTETFSVTYRVVNDDNGCVNVFRKTYYNKVRVPVAIEYPVSDVIV